MNYAHVPVMMKKAIEYLNPREGGYFVDGTLGGGGYTTEIVKRVGEKGKVLAIDLDLNAIKNYELQFASGGKNKNIILANENFKDLSNIIKRSFPESPDIKFDGVVFDLGLSSAQLADRTRGFSFQLLDAPIDMSFGGPHPNPLLRKERGKERRVYTDTQMIVNRWSEKELERIIKEYGEERYAKSIARKIVEARKNKKIEKVGELVEIIKSAVPARYQHGLIHFATRTFQALRMATNNELENLREVLPQAVASLKRGGRIIIISFHSLEDRIVKQFFKQESRDCLCPPQAPVCQCHHQASLKIIIRKALTPTAEEIKINPRARSAKMRVAERL